MGLKCPCLYYWSKHAGMSILYTWALGNNEVMAALPHKASTSTCAVHSNCYFIVSSVKGSPRSASHHMFINLHWKCGKWATFLPLSPSRWFCSWSLFSKPLNHCGGTVFLIIFLKTVRLFWTSSKAVCHIPLQKQCEYCQGLKKSFYFFFFYTDVCAYP